MTDDIIRIAFKGNARAGSAHPLVKRVVEEEVGQQGGDDSPLRSAKGSFPGRFLLSGPHGGSFQPATTVEQNPARHSVMFESLDDRVVAHTVKEGLDIKLQNPAVFPAPSFTGLQGIVG